MTPVLVHDVPSAWPMDEDDLNALTNRATLVALSVGIEDAGFAAWESDEPLTIAFLDDKRVMALNAEFRDKPTPTNVLSWPNYDGTEPDEVVPQGEADGGSCYWGDLALAGQTVSREALEQEKSFDAHLSHLIIHGILHLLGHDHIEDDQAKIMEDLERLAMRDLGYPDPYGEESA